MNSKMIKSGFFKKVRDGHLTFLEFVPHQYDTMDAAMTAAKVFIRIAPLSIMFFRRHDGKFTFVPRTGDGPSVMIRTALACGAEVMDEITILK